MRMTRIVSSFARAGRRTVLGALAALAPLAVGACKSSPDETGMGCVPGQSVTCTGASGCAGAQVCSADGTSFGACLCGPVVGD